MNSDQILPMEFRVKAAYLFNFARFVEWPSADMAPVATENVKPLLIGIVGTDLFSSVLGSLLDGKVVSGRTIQVVSVRSPSQIHALDILYFARSAEDEMAAIFENIRGRPILTVSENRRFLEKGGMVKLIVGDDNVQFAVNLKTVKESNLKISAQMLQCAKEIE